MDSSKKVQGSIDDFQKVCERYYHLIRNMPSCIAIFEPRNNGEDFVFVAFNPAAERVEKIKEEEVLGREVRDIFPGVVDFGLFDVFKEVYRTGEPAFHPVRSYRDKRISGYRENYVFRMPGGEIVAVYEDRTDQKQLEEKYKLGEERFRNLADMLPEMICETNRKNIITYANRLALERFEYSDKDLAKGIPLENLIVAEQRDLARREALHQYRNKSKISHEFTAVTKTGKTFPIFFKVSPIITHDKVSGLRGVFVDITDQKKTQEKLERETIYLNQLIQSAPEAITQTYKDGTIIRINEEFTRLFGYTEKEIIGQHIDEVLAHGDEKILKEANKITKSIGQGKRKMIESIRYHKNGTPVSVSILGTPITLHNKRIGVYGIYRDITRRKHDQLITEIMLRISETALKVSNLQEFFNVTCNYLSRILDTTNLFIALYDSKTKTFSFPFFRDEKDRFDRVPAKGTISGYVVKTGKSLMLKGKDFMNLKRAGEISMVGTVSKVWLGVPMIVKKEIVGVISLQNYDNEDTFNKDDLKLLQIFANQAAMAVVHIQSQQDILMAKEKAEENIKFKEQFLSTMSHEIRTPLNAIIGMSQLLIRSKPRKDQEEYLQALRISGESLLRLINDILDYSKLESGKMVTETIAFDPRDMINSLQKVFVYRAEEKGLKLITVIEPGIPEQLKGDPTRFTQILTNFIGNALKFTNKGSITIGLGLVKETARFADIRFYVSDTGIGIAPDKMEKIFESFTQAETDTTRKFGGTGLGLAISKRLVEMFDGKIQVDSKLGKGTTFSFILHLEKVKDLAVASGKSIIEPRILAGKKILVVEDNPLNRMLAERFMKQWGIKVESAENGKVAVEKVARKEYDLVVMDLQMPVMDGYEAARRIRQMEDKSRSTTPIIALTASVLLDVKSQVFKYGMNDVLMKPFQPESLFKILAENIRK